MSKIAQNRRENGRYDLRLPLHYRVSVKGETTRTGSATTSDISASGLSFRSRKPLPVGAHIEILIEWPAKYRDMDPMSLLVTGFIVRCDGSRIAVRMTSRKFKITMAQLESATA
jgi:c-di-GMP-binding flagellar brake protein YcgR